MKLAVFTDLHLGIKQDDTFWHNVALKWCDSMIVTLKERNVKDIIFLGDFFHNRTTISVETLNITSKFLKKLSDFNVHMILGNHDLYYDKEYTTSAVNIFDGFPNIKIYQTPEIVQFGSKKMLFCGWGYDPMEYKADVLFTHAAINVFRYNAKQSVCNEGLICSELLKNYDLVYVGHFHLRQSKKYNNGEVRYPGNPFQMDFSDEFTQKGFDIFDSETFKFEFVENVISPKFIRFKLSDFIKLNYNELGNIIKNSHFKLINDLSITISDINELMNLINGCRPCTSSYEWSNEQRVENGDDEEIVVESFEISDAIKDYISYLDAPNKEELNKYLYELYIKAEKK